MGRTSKRGDWREETQGGRTDRGKGAAAASWHGWGTQPILEVRTGTAGGGDGSTSAFCNNLHGLNREEAWTVMKITMDLRHISLVPCGDELLVVISFHSVPWFDVAYTDSPRGGDHVVFWGVVWSRPVEQTHQFHLTEGDPAIGLALKRLDQLWETAFLWVPLFSLRKRHLKEKENELKKREKRAVTQNQ